MIFDFFARWPGRRRGHVLRAAAAGAVLGALLAGLAGPVLPAAAAPAPPALTVSPPAGRPGDVVSVSGTRFPKRAPVQLTWDGASAGLPAPVTEPNGSFRVAVAIPPATSGGHVLAAGGGATGASVTVTVLAAAASTATPVPPTATTAPPTRTPTASPTRTAVPPTTTRTAVPPTATAALVSGATAGLDAEELGFLELLNRYRAGKGLGTLVPQAQLNAAADWLSKDMSDKNYLSHLDSLGRWPIERLLAFGYAQRFGGENLGLGYVDAAAVLQGWQNSPDHDRALLDPYIVEIGIGRVCSPTCYWTIDFGSRA